MPHTFSIETDRAGFDAFARELAEKQKIQIDGDRGAIEHGALSLTYDFNGQALAITLEHYPPFTAGAIEKRIRAAFAGGS